MYESEDENYLGMAQKELDLGYFESAISFYDKAINCSPNAYSYYLKGLAYYNHCTKNYLDESETSDIKSAIQNFSTAISKAPQNAIYYYYRAKANLKCIQNYDYVEVEGDRGPTHDYKLKREAVDFILADLQKAMNIESAYEEEYKRFYNSNVEQKYVLEDSSIPKKYQLNLNKDSNSGLSENETKEPLRQEKILSANSDEVKKLNRNPNNKEYKIVKTNEETNICIITDKYLNYGLSDKDLNIVLPAEYMNIQFCKDGDTNILLTKKDENGMPKYGIADKEGKIIIEPKYASIRRSLKYPDKYEINYGETFDKDSQLPFLVDIKTGEFYMEISDYEKYADQVAEDSYEVVEVFDYKTFALDLSQQSRKLVPEEIKGEDRVYIIEKIEEYANLAGEALYNDENINYNINEYKFLTQVIAEWTFHKSVDLIKGGIDGENRDYVLQKIAYTIFEVVKECIKRGIEWQTTVDTVEHHVNKVYQEVLNELYSEGRISLETYNNSIGNSNIDVWSEEQNEDHGSFYSTDEKSDSNYLKDKMLYMYGKELAYKYLVKAAHVLKKHNCNKKDRQKILKYLYGCSEYYIDSALHVEFEFKKPEMERLLTVGMEVAFHRIVVMYKNNILNNPTMAEDIIDTFASIVCAVELNYIKEKDKLKDEYYIANTIYFRELKEHLKEWLDEGKITKEQYNHALDKSGLVYLTPEITRLMKSDPFKFSRMWYMILFIVVWIIFKLIIFYTKHH